MHRWLLEVAPVAIELYRKMDYDGEGAVTTDEFKSGESELLNVCCLLSAAFLG